MLDRHPEALTVLGRWVLRRIEPLILSLTQSSGIPAWHKNGRDRAGFPLTSPGFSSLIVPLNNQYKTSSINSLLISQLFLVSSLPPFKLFYYNPHHQFPLKMVLEFLSRKTGVIVGDDVLKLFEYAQEKKFAIPAINVTSSSTVVAALEAARDSKAPIILQMSQGGAAYFAGKGVANKNQEASIAGAIAGAHYIRMIAPAYDIPVVLHTDHCAKKLLPWLDGMMDADEKYFKEHGEPLFSSHMIDLSEEEVKYNIETTAKYLKRAAPMKQWLEMVRTFTSIIL